MSAYLTHVTKVLVFIVSLCHTSCLRSSSFFGHHKKSYRYSQCLYDSNNGDSVKTSDILSLDSIRSTLIRQEETIIFALIERAQYRRNYAIYDAKRNHLRNVYGAPLSFLEWMIIETEKLHSKVRRYTSPEEHVRIEINILKYLLF